MNKVILMGHLARDAELKHSGSVDFARTAIAINRSFGKDKGADFFNLVAFGKTAEFLSKYFQKGSKILVEGHLQTSTYENKDGVKVNAVDVVVDACEFAGAKKQDQPAKSILPDDFKVEPADDSALPF